MKYLVDSNILLRLADPDNVHHVTTRNAILRLWAQRDQLQMTSQNCIEFWSVATRPRSSNGLGLDIAKAERQLRFAERVFQLVPEHPNLYPEWRSLILKFRVSGVQVHDARLVAAMRIHNFTHILTFNTADFLRYADIGIVAIDPQTI